MTPTPTPPTTPWPNPRRPLVAILRGIRPEETDGIVDALVEAGFELIEIPLNSPDPFRSIRLAVERHGSSTWIGAGTVLSVEAVDRLADVGARLLVSPNVDPAVLARAGARGLVTMPGVFTPTEALLALASGASALKFFPASVLGPAGIAAIRAVLPEDAVIGAVGGVTDASFAAYAEASIRTFGLGSSLYRPGDDAGTVARNARRAVAAYDAVFGVEGGARRP